MSCSHNDRIKYWIASRQGLKVIRAVAGSSEIKKLATRILMGRDHGDDAQGNDKSAIVQLDDICQELIVFLLTARIPWEEWYLTDESAKRKKLFMLFGNHLKDLQRRATISSYHYYFRRLRESLKKCPDALTRSVSISFGSMQQESAYTFAPDSHPAFPASDQDIERYNQEIPFPIYKIVEVTNRETTITDNLPSSPQANQQQEAIKPSKPTLIGITKTLHTQGTLIALARLYWQGRTRSTGMPRYVFIRDCMNWIARHSPIFHTTAVTTPPLEEDDESVDRWEIEISQSPFIPDHRSPEDLAIDAEFEEKTAEFICTLKKTDAKIMEDILEGGMTLKEIADRAGLKNPSNVAYRLKVIKVAAEIFLC